MEAIVEIAGFQYKIKEKSKIKVPKLKGKEGDKVTFPVLTLIDGDSSSIGTPYLENVKCHAEIAGSGKSTKKLLYKYKSKKRYRIKKSHRQPYTILIINSISPA